MVVNVPIGSSKDLTDGLICEAHTLSFLPPKRYNQTEACLVCITLRRGGDFLLSIERDCWATGPAAIAKPVSRQQEVSSRMRICS